MSLISPDKLKQVNLAANIVAMENLIKNVEKQLEVDTDCSRCPNMDVKVNKLAIWHILWKFYNFFF